MRALSQWYIDNELADEFKSCDCRKYSQCGCYDSPKMAWSLVDDWEPGMTGTECLACGATWTSFGDE